MEPGIQLQIWGPDYLIKGAHRLTVSGFLHFQFNPCILEICILFEFGF